MSMLIPMSQLAAGESGSFQRVENQPALCRRLATLGFRPGARLTVVRRVSGGGRIVAVSGSRVALGRELLECSWVEAER